MLVSKNDRSVTSHSDDKFIHTNDSSVLQTPTGYPYIQIFYNVTRSLAATNAMTALILILGFFGNVTVMAGSSRQLFAFARDEGMPFSKWISKVHIPQYHGHAHMYKLKAQKSDSKKNALNRSTQPSTPPSTQS
jgi:amino acid transporter